MSLNERTENCSSSKYSKWRTEKDWEPLLGQGELFIELYPSSIIPFPAKCFSLNLSFQEFQYLSATPAAILGTAQSLLQLRIQYHFLVHRKPGHLRSMWLFRFSSHWLEMPFFNNSTNMPQNTCETALTSSHPNCASCILYKQRFRPTSFAFCMHLNQIDTICSKVMPVLLAKTDPAGSVGLLLWRTKTSDLIT